MNIHLKRHWGLENAFAAAALYEEAFGVKISRAIPNKEKRIAIFADSFNPEFSFAAESGGQMFGLAGFKTHSGSLTGGIGFSELIEKLGLFGGLWACLILYMYERKPQKRELVMDGIAVNSNFRGQGVGSRLLDAVVGYASEHQYASVRLDVIDGNERARKLYESKGFVATEYEGYPYLKWLLGFSGATTMVLNIDNR